MVAADTSPSLEQQGEQDLSNQIIPLNLVPAPQAGTSKNIKKNGKSIKLLVKKNTTNTDLFSTIKTQQNVNKTNSTFHKTSCRRKSSAK
jgi:hypothetical protein